MILNLDTERLRSLAEVRAFLDGSDPVDFRLADRDDACAFVRRTLVRFRYAELGKPAKGLLRRFLGKVTGLSRAQLTRLIGQYRATGRIEDRRRRPARPFERRYTPTWRRPTRSSSRSTTPRSTSSRASPSPGSTPSPCRSATTTPPQRSTPRAPNCSASSPGTGPRSRDPPDRPPRSGGGDKAPVL